MSKCDALINRCTSRFLLTIDIEYNKRLDHQQPCLEGDFNGGSNNIVQSNRSVNNKRLDHQQPCLEGDFNGGSNNIVQSNKSVRRW